MVNIMVSVIEVLGMLLFYSVLIFVEDFDKIKECEVVGKVICNLFERDIKFCDIMIVKVFENVMVVVMVLGGLINVVLYLIVMVRSVDVDLGIDDF